MWDVVYFLIVLLFKMCPTETNQVSWCSEHLLDKGGTEKVRVHAVIIGPGVVSIKVIMPEGCRG